MGEHFRNGRSERAGFGRRPVQRRGTAWLDPQSYSDLSHAQKQALWRDRQAAKSRPTARSKRRGKRSPAGWLLPVALMAVGLADRTGLLSGLRSRPVASASGASAVTASFDACKWGGGVNCVVDGDTIYLEGQKIRIAGIDAPETHDYGCDSELALGEQAAARLQQLLNTGPVTLSSIDRDEDVYGRKLRNVSVDGADVGDTLIGEGLARAYAGGRRGWC